MMKAYLNVAMKKRLMAVALLAIGTMLTRCSNSDFSGSSQPPPQKVAEKKPTVTNQNPAPAAGGSPTAGNDLVVDEGQMCGDSQPGFGGKIYQLPNGTQYLPNFASMTPIGQLNSPNLDVPARKFTTGFPGIPGLVEYFAIRFYGTFEVPTDGAYRFSTNSDDGSKLYINNNLILTNDGVHGPTKNSSSTVQLKKGTQKIVIEWFQGPREQIALQVYWSVNGGPETILPVGVVSHRDLCDLLKTGTFGQ